MRPTFSTPNEIQLNPTPSYSSITPKISSSSFQRGFGLGLGFNSPKNDSQKVITLSTRVTTDIQKNAQRSERAGVIVDRKNLRPPGDQYSKPAQTSLSVSKTNQAMSDGLSGRIQNNRDSSVPRKKEAPVFQGLSSNRQLMPNQAASSSDLQSSLRRELGYSSKGRTLEIDTEQESGRIPVGLKIQSAKNAEIGHYTLNNSAKKSFRSQYTIEKPGKLSASTTPTGFQGSNLIFSPGANTEPNEDISPLTGVILKNKTDSAAKLVAGGAFFGGMQANRNQSREKGKSSEREQEKQKVVITGNRKIGFSSNGQLKYTNLNQGLIKANNFFTNGGNSTSAMANKDRTPTNQVYKIDYNAMKANQVHNQARPGTSEKTYARTQTDLASAGRIVENKPTLEYKRTHSELKRMEQSESKEQDKDDSPTFKKASLQSFVTKVDKGDFALNLKKSTTDPESQPNQHASNKTISETDSPTRGKSHSPERRNGDKARTYENLDNVHSNKLSASTNNLEQKDQTGKLSRPITPIVKKEIRDIFEAQAPALDKKAFIYYMTSLEKYHKDYDQSSYFCQIYREHFMQSYQAIVFCKYLKPVDQKVLASKKVSLYKRDTHKDKRTLIFDMDETLIHCNESPTIPSDVVLPIRFPTGEIIEAGINIRPFALECLKELSQYYEIIVFTASHSSYANVVLDYLDPHGLYIHHRLFREHCMPTEEGVYVKDLRVIANRNLQDVIIVDNASYSFGYQVDNGIPIIPFYDNKSDQELKHLIPYLKFLSTVKDMREINRLTFKMGLYHLYGSMEEVLENIVFQQS